MEEEFLFEDGDFFDDSEAEIIPDLVSVPPLCLTCKKNGMRGEDNLLCTLSRAEQSDSDDFECTEYEPMERNS
ncbi:MAG: hypothetical protein ACLFSB_05810 [Chitinispirillaceae bacterium]